MVEQATALVLYKEFPHTDFAARAEDLFRLIVDAAEGRTRPHMALWDCRMLGSYFTTLQPMKGFVDDVKALEGRDGVLSISPVHGFPYGDVPGNGTKMLVITDARPAEGARLAERLGLRWIALRGRTHPPDADGGGGGRARPPAPGRPVVAADVADNPGGGFPGDSTVVLRALVELGVTDCAFATIWDPVAVTFARAAGPGGRLRMRIGGKAGVLSGDPLDLDVTVAAVTDDLYQRYAGVGNSLGPAARVTAGGIDIILASRRNQVRSPDVFRGLGLDPLGAKLLVVKSTNHFRAEFEKIAAEILYVAPPDVFSACRSRGSRGRSGRSIPTRSPTWKRPAWCPPAGRARTARPTERRGPVRRRRPAADEGRLDEATPAGAPPPLGRGGRWLPPMRAGASFPRVEPAVCGQAQGQHRQRPRHHGQRPGQMPRHAPEAPASAQALAPVDGPEDLRERRAVPEKGPPPPIGDLPARGADRRPPLLVEARRVPGEQGGIPRELRARVLVANHQHVGRAGEVGPAARAGAIDPRPPWRGAPRRARRRPPAGRAGGASPRPAAASPPRADRRRARTRPPPAAPSPGPSARRDAGRGSRPRRHPGACEPGPAGARDSAASTRCRRRERPPTRRAHARGPCSAPGRCRRSARAGGCAVAARPGARGPRASHRSSRRPRPGSRRP